MKYAKLMSCAEFLNSEKPRKHTDRFQIALLKYWPSFNLEVARFTSFGVPRQVCRMLMGGVRTVTIEMVMQKGKNQ